MKILFVANVAKEHINKFHIPTIKEFKKHGWIVDVACSGGDEVPECDKRFITCWKRTPFTIKTIKGVIQLRKIINENNYDVVYCHTPVGGLIGRLAARKAKKKGTKVVYCAHGLHFFKGAPIINWMIFYPIEKILAYFTDLFITINREDYELVKTKFNKELDVKLINGIGVNFERFNIEEKALVRHRYREEFKVSDDTTVLVYVAELLKNKNQKMLVDVLDILRSRGENVVLFLVGPDHDNCALQRYIDLNNLTEYVKLLGWRNDVAEILSSADIYVASSIREGFGLNIVEAMYCGLPVVAVNNRGHRMIIDDKKNGFLVDLNDVISMSDRVSLLINNREIYKKMSNVDVLKYDSSVVASILFDIISS